MKSTGTLAIKCMQYGVLLCMLPGCYRPHKPRSLKAQRERVQRLKPQKPTKQIKHMHTDEAIAAAGFYEELGHKDMIVASYHHIITIADDPEIAGNYLLKLADFYLGDGNIPEAKKQYQRMLTIYPGHSAIERAHYRNIVAHYWSMLTAGRDQSATHTTIKLAKQYLSEYPHNVDATQKVRDIIASAYQRLLAHEVLVIHFYLNQFSIDARPASLKAAIQRLQFVAEKVLDQMKPFTPQITSLYDAIVIPAEDTDIRTQSPTQLSQVAHIVSSKVHIITQFLEQHTIAGPDRVHPRDKF